MKTRIYFVRHAEPDFSIKDDLTRPLSEKGMANAKKVTISLMDKNITAVYSSPCKRAVDTVKDFASAISSEIIIKNDFCERKVGTWVDDFKTYSRKQWTDFDFKLTGGESLREVQTRNISALLSIIKDNDGKNVAIGTHGTALSTIINHYNPAFGYDDFWNIVDKMPYILCFEFDDMNIGGVKEIAI
jgi:2,3-bisphosphoglycerate-dependent phosphoglycerate mutase